jgi:hypothetical protein
MPDQNRNASTAVMIDKAQLHIARIRAGAENDRHVIATSRDQISSSWEALADFEQTSAALGPLSTVR